MTHAFTSPFPGQLPRLNAIRTLVVMVMALGYISTMPLGPGTPEFVRLYGYEPSLFAIQILFALSGWLALRSLDRHGSPLRMLASRARRNLIPLAIVTAVVVLIIYPWMQVGEGMSAGERLAYFLKTVSCLNPGTVMPGALDTAHYACLLQGAIWTFRWGALAYLATALLWWIGGMKDRRLLLALAVLTTLAYAVLHYLEEKTTIRPMDSLLVAMRFGYPFVCGLAAYAWADRLSASLSWVFGLLIFAGVNYLFLPWTPFIEITASLGLSLLALKLATGDGPKGRWLEGWPPLALPIFILNWPVAQSWLYVQPDLSVLATLGLASVSTLVLAALLALLLRPVRGWDRLRT